MFLQRFLLQKASFLVGGLLAAMIVSCFAIAPQISLWVARGGDWKGVHATNDLDESFYAAYIQSLIDGKPRRNSPYSGAIDTAETPQKESYLSIQFLASYPPAILARLFGLSSPTVMILMGIVIGFLSGFALFWLLYLLSQDAGLSFVGTVTVLFGGALVAGQGSLLGWFTNSNHYEHSLIFMRRSLPAMGFPALIFFFIFIWKFISAASDRQRLISGVFAIACFAFTVYSYFYYWTTAAAWLFGLIIIWLCCRFDEIRKHWICFTSLAAGLLITLAPYVIMILNRSDAVDSELSLKETHQPDLLRTPEVVSYLAFTLIVLACVKRWLPWRKPQIPFILSFTLVAPLVFNQQVITGLSLQPFHYEFFSANYLALLSLFMVIFLLLKHRLEADVLNKTLLLTSAAAILIGYYDTVAGAEANKFNNIWRDELMQVSNRIKVLSAEIPPQIPPPVVLSFDLSMTWANSVDIPSLSSQPVLWGIHMTMFPDITYKDSSARLNRFLYYHNYDEKKLKDSFGWGPAGALLSYGFFKAERILPIYSGGVTPITEQEIDDVVNQYAIFRRDFSYEDAAHPRLSFVLVHRYIEQDLSAVDKWYQRDTGEEIGEYILYRVTLRDRSPTTKFNME